MKKRFFPLILLFCCFVSNAFCMSSDTLAERWNDTVKYTPEMVGRELLEFSTTFPEILSLDTIGYSVEKRPLYMVKMGKGDTKIFALASIHAREYISTALVMKDIENMVSAADKGESFGPYDMKLLLDSCTFYIVPMINPDGVDISQHYPWNRGESFLAIPIDERSQAFGYASWKANANGVDLNRNFPHGWENNIKSPATPCSNEYKGIAPLSEPETKALAAALHSVNPDGVIAYHTQGEVLYISDPTPLYRALGEEIGRLTGFTREPAGPPYGSLQDYVDDEFGVFYVCVELCPYVGPFPFPDQSLHNAVWPKARYILPMAGSILSGLEIISDSAE